MRKTILRVLCAIMCITICMPYMPAPARAGETATTQAAIMAQAEHYRDRVLTRYFHSLETSSYFENLQYESDYLYEQWAAETGDMPAYEQFFTALTNVSMDKALDEEAYTVYLTKLLHMVEAGFAETSAAQAEYTAMVGAADLFDSGITIASKLLGFDKSLSAFAAAADYFDAGTDMLLLYNGAIEQTEDMLFVASEGALFEKKLLVLSAIAENTDDMQLKAAAEQMLKATAVQFEDTLQKYFDDSLDVAMEAAMTSMGIDGYGDYIPKLISAPFAAISKIGETFKLDKAFIAEFDNIVNACGVIASYAAPIVNSYVIASEIMKLAFGDVMECYREMRAMSAISDALCKGMQNANRKAIAEDPDEQYEAVQEFVAVTEALIYSRLRGDYCFMLSNQLSELEGAKGAASAALYPTLGGGTITLNLLIDKLAEAGITDELFESTSKVAEYYDYLEMNMENYYNVISGIFPDNEPQVVVTTELKYTQGEDFYTALYMPYIEVVGNDEVTRRINSGSVLETFIRNKREGAQLYRDYDEYYLNFVGDEQSDLKTYFTVCLEDAHYAGGLLSLIMRTQSWTFGGWNFNYTGRKSFLIDTTTGEFVGVNALLDPEVADAADRMVDAIAAAIEEQVGWVWTTFTEVAEAVVYENDYRDYDLSRICTLTADGLVLQFDSEQIAPHAEGSPTVVVPYEALDGIISSKFMPDDSIYMADHTIYTPSTGEPMSDVARVYGTESAEAVRIIGDALDVTIDETRYTFKFTSEYGELFSSIVFYANHLTDEMVWLPENTGGDNQLSYDEKSVSYHTDQVPN